MLSPERNADVCTVDQRSETVPGIVPDDALKLRGAATDLTVTAWAAVAALVPTLVTWARTWMWYSTPGTRPVTVYEVSSPCPSGGVSWSGTGVHAPAPVNGYWPSVVRLYRYWYAEMPAPAFHAMSTSPTAEPVLAENPVGAGAVVAVEVSCTVPLAPMLPVPTARNWIRNVAPDVRPVIWNVVVERVLLGTSVQSWSHTLSAGAVEPPSNRYWNLSTSLVDAIELQVRAIEPGSVPCVASKLDGAGSVLEVAVAVPAVDEPVVDP